MAAAAIVGWWASRANTSATEDGAAAVAAGAPVMEEGPRTRGNGGIWEIEWDMPGTHTLLCRVEHRPLAGDPPPPRLLSFSQTVHDPEEALENRFADANPAMDPDVRLEFQRRYLDGVAPGEGVELAPPEGLFENATPDATEPDAV